MWLASFICIALIKWIRDHVCYRFSANRMASLVPISLLALVFGAERLMFCALVWNMQESTHIRRLLCGHNHIKEIEPYSRCSVVNSSQDKKILYMKYMKISKLVSNLVRLQPVGMSSVTGRANWSFGYVEASPLSGKCSWSMFRHHHRDLGTGSLDKLLKHWSNHGIRVGRIQMPLAKI